MKSILRLYGRFSLAKRLRKFLVLIPVFLTGFSGFAQTLKTYESKLVSPTNKPIVGATIQNTQRGAATISGANGEFSIQAAFGDSLKITARNYLTAYYVIPDTIQASIPLSFDDVTKMNTAGEVQKIYTTSPAYLNLASNSVIYSPDITKNPVTDFRNTLTGRLAGVYTLQTTGLPGADGALLGVRGQSPLIIIDGTPVGRLQNGNPLEWLTTIDLEEIESITVLKDALGTATLGVRGSNNAIVVTTKKGRADKQQISFTAQTASQKAFGTPTTLRSYDYARLYNEALTNDGLPTRYTPADLQAYQNGTDAYGHPDVDWRNEVLKNSSRFNRYTLNASGGNSVARYFVSLDHINQSGFFKTVDSNAYNTNNNFKSYIIRSNIDVNITNKLTGGIYLLGRILNSNEPGFTTASILGSLLSTPANAYPVLNQNGSFGGTQQFQNNILAQTISSGYRQNYKRDVLVNLYLRRTLDEVVKGLYVQARASYYGTLSENIFRNKTFAVYQPNATGGYAQYGVNGTITGTSSGVAYQGRSDYEELKVGYDLTFNNRHGINAVVLANRDNSTSDAFLPYTLTGSSARISYNFKEKYLVEAAMAYNGSNRYPNKGKTKRGFFPAIGLGWNINKEAFLQDVSFISALKLSASIGKTGNDNPGDFVYYQRYFDAAATYFGTGATANTTIPELTFANPGITWEKATKVNVGVSGSLFNDAISFSAEYFKDRYSDLLQQRGRNSATAGNTFPNENIGKNQYYGFEFQAGWKGSTGGFQYFINANASTLQSKVIFNDEVFVPYEWMKRTGQSVGRRFGFIADGLFQSQADITGSPKIVGYNTPQPGDIKYKDLNGDGQVDQFDVAPIGTDKPLFYYGISLGVSFKGFDISSLIQGVQNRDIYVGGASYWAFQSGGFGQAYADNLNRWTPATAATATYPRLNIGANVNNQRTSSFWLVSGSYLRLKNAEIGYSLPAKVIGHIKLQTVRLFVNGYNLLTSQSDALGGRDAEVTSAFLYPNQRLVNAGINIKF